MLRQSLKSLGGDPARLFEATGIAPTARAEELSVVEFCALARASLAGASHFAEGAQAHPAPAPQALGGEDRHHLRHAAFQGIVSAEDRDGVSSGKSVSGRVDLGVRR